MPSGVYKRNKKHLEQLKTCIKIMSQLPRSEKQINQFKLCQKIAYALPKSKKQISHYKKNGSKRGSMHSTWKGGVSSVEGGYVFLFNPSHPFANKSYVREHRMVVEYFLGRVLLEKESVHHINEIKVCNHPCNLMAFVNESAHQRFHKGGTVKLEEIIFDGRKLTENCWELK